MCAEATSSIDGGIGSDQFRSEWSDEAAQFLKGLSFELPHDSITSAVRSGDPAGAIVEEAKRIHAGTIVVGNRRAQGISRVLGSVAASVVRTAPCDVLIAHTT